jgi:FG-GAP-like repeat
MRTPRATAWIGAGLGLAVLGTGACVERVIHDLGGCGSGGLDPGEICLGQGARSTLAIEGLAGLLLRVADFDGDAHLDLMVLGTEPGDVVRARLWRGRGDGTFLPAFDPGVQGCSAYAVAGDADGDPATDLLVGDCGPSISLLLGTPTGMLTPPLTVATGLETRSSALLDLDDDGRREVVVLGTDPAGAHGLAVSERRPDGSFDPAVASPLPPPSDGFDPFGLGILDLDRDDRFDALLVHAARPGGLALARGEPGLRFAAPQPVGPPSLVANTALVRDLDGDGATDVLAVSFPEEALVFLHAEDALLVETARTHVPALDTGPAGAGDIDADGHLDLLLFEPGTRALAAWFGRGDGGFSGPLAVALDAAVGQIALVDLDEDGALDIVVGTFEAGALQILLSDP